MEIMVFPKRLNLFNTHMKAITQRRQQPIVVNVKSIDFKTVS